MLSDLQFNSIVGEDEITGVWEMLKAAYKVLDAWDRSGINEM